jgi:hypothetical protein
MGHRTAVDVMEKREIRFPLRESNPDFSFVQLKAS